MRSETIQRAARLMHKRAEAATSGPWVAAGEDLALGLGPYALCALTASRNVEADVEHIASWHPAVTLAVAAWLDVFDGVPSNSITDDHPALVLARAYLGESA